MLKKVFKYFGLTILGIIVIFGIYLGYKYITLPEVTATEHSIASDCETVYFASEKTGNREFFKLNINSGDLTQLTSDGNKKHYPVISPNGEMLAFSLRWKGDWYLAKIHLKDLSAERILKTYTFNPVRPAWSEDSESVFYPSERDGDRDIFVYNLSSKTEQNLSQTPGIDDHVFVRGEQVFFSSERDGNKELYVMSVNGENSMRFTNNDYYDGNPSLDSDSQVYFTSRANQLRQIKKITVNGQREQVLLESTDKIYYPEVCRNGSFLIFASEQDGDVALFKLDLQSGKSHRIDFDID